jgi:hypothetical protein
MLGARIVYYESSFKIVQRVEDQIDTVQIIFNVRWVYVVDPGFDLNGRIDPAQFRFGGYRLGKIAPHIALIEQRLALQVREFHKISIDQPDKADAGADNLIGGNSSKGPKADQQNSGRREAQLAGFADGGKSNLARVTFIRIQGLPSPA